MDFSEDLRALKTFLSIRDTSPLFEQIRGSGKIGIPCIVKKDGSVTLTWDEFV